MTKLEAMRLTRQNDNLRRFGFTSEECDQLRRISLTLSHWAERECNEDIRTGFYRGGEFVDCANPEECKELGSTCGTYTFGQGNHRGYRIPNREAGALRRLAAIMVTRKRTLTYYHQTDPRGAALYLVPLAKLRQYGKTKADLDCCYSQVGIAVY